MIKFFRNIRKTMLTEGNTVKYLKYAIGEIILVVIGILIALQINTWNTQRIADKQMMSFLKSMQEDLKSDTLHLNIRVKYFKRLQEEKKWLLSLKNFENIDADSVYTIMNARTSNYNINEETFNKIKSLGITNISNNEHLSEELTDYYTANAISLNSFMDWDWEMGAYQNRFWAFGQNQFEIDIKSFELTDTVGILNFQDDSTNKQNLIKILSEPRGRNILKVDYYRKRRLEYTCTRLKEEATKRIKDIQTELDK